MKLTRHQIDKNLKIYPTTNDEVPIDREKFYSQFECCPMCGGPSTGPDTEEFVYGDVQLSSTQYRRCNSCRVTWSFKKYRNIENDPAYIEYQKDNRLKLHRPKLERPKPVVVKEGGCMVYIAAAVAVTAVGGLWLL